MKIFSGSPSSSKDNEEAFVKSGRESGTASSAGSSGSGTLSRNQGGSREDLQSGESRDSRVSTAANSQSSSVYDNVKVM